MIKLKRAFRITANGKARGDESLRQVVFTHGGYQAAYFLEAYNPFSPGDESGSGSLGLGDDVLNKVGVWYDFSSMPQDPDTREQLISPPLRGCMS